MPEANLVRQRTIESAIGALYDVRRKLHRLDLHDEATAIYDVMERLEGDIRGD